MTWQENYPYLKVEVNTFQAYLLVNNDCYILSSTEYHVSNLSSVPGLTEKIESDQLKVMLTDDFLKPSFTVILIIGFR